MLLVTTHNPAVNWLRFLIWQIGGITTPIYGKEKAQGNVEHDVNIRSNYLDYELGKSSSEICGGFCAIREG